MKSVLQEKVGHPEGKEAKENAGGVICHIVFLVDLRKDFKSSEDGPMCGYHVFDVM